MQHRHFGIVEERNDCLTQVTGSRDNSPRVESHTEDNKMEQPGTTEAPTPSCRNNSEDGTHANEVMCHTFKRRCFCALRQSTFLYPAICILFLILSAAGPARGSKVNLSPSICMAVSQYKSVSTDSCICQSIENRLEPNSMLS